MAEDDKSLANILRNLEISVHSKTGEKVHKSTLATLNEFRPRSRSTGSICCSNCVRTNARIKLNFNSKVSFKPKLLRDPILNYTPKHLANEGISKSTNSSVSPKKQTLPKSSGCKKNRSRNFRKSFGNSYAQLSNNVDFKSLLESCEKLTITNQDKYKSKSFQGLRIKYKRCQDKDILKPSKSELEACKAASNPSTSNSTCSQEAMATMTINTPCDVTIDELASYFETMVHIPKKMSSMAEMMYI